MENVEDPEQGGGEGAGVRICFKAVVRWVLLFCAETWVDTPRMGRILGGFQYQVARRLEERMPRQRLHGMWYYTLVEAAREEAGFEPIETYVWQRKNTAA